MDWKTSPERSPLSRKQAKCGFPSRKGEIQKRIITLHAAGIDLKENCQAVLSELASDRTRRQRPAQSAASNKIQKKPAQSGLQFC